MTPGKLKYRGVVYRRADLLGRRVVDPYVPGGPAQPYLYHLTDAASLLQIRQQGLCPGTGTNWNVLGTQQHSQGRVFFSTQPDKWVGSFNSLDRILLRVPTVAVSCIYDGGEWLYSGDEPKDEIIDGRLTDCYCTDTIPPHLIEYSQDVPDAITDATVLVWNSLVHRKSNHVGDIVLYRGAVYRCATTAHQDEFGAWFIGNPRPDPGEAGYDDPNVDQDGVDYCVAALEDAYDRTIAPAAKSLGLGAPSCWFERLERHDVARYVDGTYDPPLILIDARAFQNQPDPQPELVLSVLHELAHAYIYTTGQHDELDPEQEERLAEGFARQYRAGDKKKAVMELKRGTGVRNAVAAGQQLAKRAPRFCTSKTILYRGAVYREAEVTRHPRTFYHGTNSGLFREFDPSIAAKGGQFWNPLGNGMYVTDQPSFARNFGPNVHKVVIPAGARYRRINMNTWRSTGRSLVFQAMRDALRAVGESPIRDMRTRLGLGFLVDLDRCLYGNSPYESLYESSVLVEMHFGSDVSQHYEAYLPKRADQKFKQYDFIVFTETNDPIGYYDEKSGTLKSPLEVVIFNPAMQKIQAAYRVAGVDTAIAMDVRKLFAHLTDPTARFDPYTLEKKTADVYNVNDPWRNEYTDIREALEHAADFYDIDPIDEDLDPDDFVITRTYMTLAEIEQYDDVEAWIDAEPNELLDADEDTIQKWSHKLRGKHYNDILEHGIPALVVINTSQYTGLADGRGRYNLAVALGIKKLPVILLTEKQI